MIVDDKFLEVYSFILPAAVVITHASSHAVALERMLKMTPDQWTELSSSVSAAPNSTASTVHVAVTRRKETFLFRGLLNLPPNFRCCGTRVPHHVILSSVFCLG